MKPSITADIEAAVVWLGECEALGLDDWQAFERLLAAERDKLPAYAPAALSCYLFGMLFAASQNERTKMNGQGIDFKPLPYPQTPQSARRWFVRHGINRSQWAAYFGLERTTVEHLLGGRYRGRRGAAHEAAVKLGLKEEPND